MLQGINAMHEFISLYETAACSCFTLTKGRRGGVVSDMVELAGASKHRGNAGGAVRGWRWQSPLSPCSTFMEMQGIAVEGDK